MAIFKKYAFLLAALVFMSFLPENFKNTGKIEANIWLTDTIKPAKYTAEMLKTPEYDVPPTSKVILVGTTKNSLPTEGVQTTTRVQQKVDLDKILIIIDGKKMDKGSDINKIDVNTIERMDVIKGKEVETYTSKYDVKYPIEGVILITTKKK
jgi:hypothetical protein